MDFCYVPGTVLRCFMNVIWHMFTHTLLGSCRDPHFTEKEPKVGDRVPFSHSGDGLVGQRFDYSIVFQPWNHAIQTPSQERNYS